VPGDGKLERGAIGPDADARRSIGGPSCWEGLGVADRPVGDAGSALACEGCGVSPACVRWICFGIGNQTRGTSQYGRPSIRSPLVDRSRGAACEEFASKCLSHPPVLPMTASFQSQPPNCAPIGFDSNLPRWRMRVHAARGDETREPDTRWPPPHRRRGHRKASCHSWLPLCVRAAAARGTHRRTSTTHASLFQFRYEPLL